MECHLLQIRGGLILTTCTGGPALLSVRHFRSHRCEHHYHCTGRCSSCCSPPASPAFYIGLIKPLDVFADCLNNALPPAHASSSGIINCKIERSISPLERHNWSYGIPFYNQNALHYARPINVPVCGKYTASRTVLCFGLSVLKQEKVWRPNKQTLLYYS